MIADDEALGEAPGGREINGGRAGLVAFTDIGEFHLQVHRVVNTGFGFARAGFGTAAQPLDFLVDQVGERILFAALGFQKFGALFQKAAVRPGSGKQAKGVSPIDLGDAGTDFLQEVTIVSDENRSDPGRFE